MKTAKTKNKGINMNVDDVRSMLEKKRERLSKQQVRKEKLEQTMTNTLNDIEQLEYTLQQMERAEKIPPKEIPSEKTLSFFTSVIRVYEYIQHHSHRCLNYVWFCLVVKSRYNIESHIHASGRRILSSCTILNYFKREHDLYLSCAS